MLVLGDSPIKRYITSMSFEDKMHTVLVCPIAGYTKKHMKNKTDNQFYHKNIVTSTKLYKEVKKKNFNLSPRDPLKLKYNNDDMMDLSYRLHKLKMTKNSFIKETNYSLTLVPEPDNQYDSNAIAIKCKNNTSLKDYYLGYVPKKLRDRKNKLYEIEFNTNVNKIIQYIETEGFIYGYRIIDKYNSKKEKDFIYQIYAGFFLKDLDSKKLLKEITENQCIDSVLENLLL